MLVAAEDLALGEQRQFTARQIGMAQRNNRLIRPATGLDGRQRLLVNSLHPDHQAITIGGYVNLIQTQIGTAQIGNRRAPGPDLPLPIGERHNQPIGLQTTSGIPRDGTDQMKIEGLEQFVRGIELGRRIVVTGDGNQIEMRELLVYTGQKAVELLPTGRRRIGRIEDIARNQQAVNLPLPDQRNQPVEKIALLVASIMAMQMMAQMPVGGV